MQEISEVANHIRKAEGVCFIIGAGAALSAGIPGAKGLVELVKANYGHCLDGLSEQDQANYGKVMHKLTPPEREKIILPLLENSRVNWGHIALATLAREKFVKRVLTFNFDLILERAVSLLGFQMPVYDFAVAQTTDIDQIARSSILHLHGQSHGLVLLNSEKETQAHKEKLRPILRDTVRSNTTIVIGYSGESDGAFDVIHEEYNFRNRLIWLGHSNNAPPHLKPLLANEYAKYIGGCDFDQTMMEIARELNIWPPAIFENPMQHLLEELNDVTDFPVQKETEHDVLTITRERLQAFAQNWEKEESPDARANSLLLSGSSDSSKVESLSAHVDEMSVKARDAFSWVAINAGDKFVDAALLLSEEQAASEFSKAYESYRRALKIEPKSHYTLYNWGTALSNEAQMRTGSERSEKLADAISKFKQALEIKPDKHDALSNWGAALSQEAEMLTGKERSEKLADAISKFKLALVVEPDNKVTLDNWGNTIFREAQMLTGKEKSKKIAEAKEKFVRAKALSGKSSYNFACFFALTDDLPSALTELQACQADGTLPDFEHLNLDTDLDSLRENDEFIELLESIRP